MSNKPEISEAELHAYIDGALEAERRHEVETIIAHNPELSGRVDAFRSDMAMLKQIYAPLIERPVPQEWIARAHASQPRSSMAWQKYASIAAALLVVIAGAIYWQIQSRGPAEIVEAALQARQSASEPQKVIAASPSTAPTEYDAALRTAVAANIKVPDMTRMGFRLTELRVYSETSGGAAELVYRDASNRVFTLYVRRSDGTVRFDQFERNGLRVCVWQDEVMSTVMSGNVSTAAMQRLASLAYTGMTL